MKYMVLLFIVLMLQLNIAQVFEIKNIETVPLESGVSFYFPKFTPRGDQLILTRSNHQELNQSFILKAI